jgi:FkbM family methyltransferase
MKLLMTQEDVAYIHHKYYSEVINNKWGTRNINSDDIKVDEFYFKTHPNDTVISDSLRQGILFEKFYLSFLKQFINPKKNILDIGANIGVHSVIYSNYLTTGTVYAFEPQKVVYDILSANLNKNKCDNVIPLNIGVSNSNTSLFMAVDYESKKNHGGFAICEEQEGVKGITIECKRIDDLNISNVGYVKIDVEGHEYEALLGMKELMNRDKPFLFIEIHDFSPTKNDVFQLIEDLGYTQYMKMSHCDYLFMGLNINDV